MSSIAISASGTTLASSSSNRDEIKLWRLPDGALLKTLEGHFGGVGSLAISPDGQMLASKSWDKTIRLWSLPDGVYLKTLTGSSESKYGLVVSPDGKMLASENADESILLWSLPDGTFLKTLTGPKTWRNALAISPDGKTLASGGGDKAIMLWSLPDGALLKTLTGHTERIDVLAISPDGKTLASGSDDNSIMLWSLPDGALLKKLSGHTQPVRCLAISPDGKTLASGGRDDSIMLWSLPDGALLKKLSGHSIIVECLAISPDGKMLASGGLDSSIRLWSLLDGVFIRCLADPVYLPRGDSAIPSRSSGRSWTESCPGGPVRVPPGAICTCNCVPVCQAHRLLHSDPEVRTIAEELLLYMGPGQFNYMRWAADKADSALQGRIVQVMAAIEAGARPDPKRWPSTEKCFDRLHDADEVVAIMAAQTLHHLRSRESMALDPSLQERIDTLLSEAQQRPWFVRYSASGQPRENV